MNVIRPLVSKCSSRVCFQKGDWAAEKVITVPSKKVEGWALPEMPSEYRRSQSAQPVETVQDLQKARVVACAETCVIFEKRPKVIPVMRCWHKLMQVTHLSRSDHRHPDLTGRPLSLLQ